MSLASLKTVTISESQTGHVSLRQCMAEINDVNIMQKVLVNIDETNNQF